jgi:uncharacterized protein
MMQLLQLLAACALGALLMYGFERLRGRENAEVKRLQAKLTAKTDELSAYKSDVQEHFLGTAQAIDALTRSYRGVFAQLERDAHRLVGETPFQRALAERQALERATPELAAVDETPLGGAETTPVPDNPAAASQTVTAPPPARPAVHPAPNRVPGAS